MKNPVYEQMQAREVKVMQLEDPGAPYLVDGSWITVDELLDGNSRTK
jgi:hypothetical protein